MKSRKKNSGNTQKENFETIETTNEKTHKSKKQRNHLLKTRRSTPMLLLSYTYFLNPNHTCYISIGYDVETFKLKIILYKNMTNQEWLYEDWDYMYKNSTVIQNKFLEGIKSDTYSNRQGIGKNDDGNKLSYKVLFLRQDRKVITFKTGAIKITMTSMEWLEFYKILNFLNSVVKMYNTVWYEVEQYYNLYFDRCNQLQVDELPHSEYFIPIPTTYSYCNFSRLFNEIPVLCQKKIQQDRYFNIVYTNIES